MRIYPDCEVCAGTGSVRVAHQSGFFTYAVGSHCYACTRREQEEIANRSKPATQILPDRRIELLTERLQQLEERVDDLRRRAVFKYET